LTVIFRVGIMALRKFDPQQFRSLVRGCGRPRESNRAGGELRSQSSGTFNGERRISALGNNDEFAG
jgi:hypothetical protein